jgi:outer membrane protein
MIRRVLVLLTAVFMVAGVLVFSAPAEQGKIGFVDLRKAFFEYEKTKTFESELNKLTDSRQQERTKKVEKVSKMRDELELLSGDARNKKQTLVEKEIAGLNEYDRSTRQMLLDKRNDMFREVVEDIQKIVDDLGKKGKYDFVFDSRNIMYGKEQFDLTDEVVKQLNK